MIVRGPRPQGNFYLLDKAISEDRRLTWAARGLLVYLLGKPDFWQVSPAALVSETADSARPLGREGVYTLLAEVQAAGYMTRVQLRNADGSMGAAHYTVSETSTVPAIPKPAPAAAVEVAPQTGLPHTAPQTGLPYTVKTTQASTEEKQGLKKENAGAKFCELTGKLSGIDPEQIARWSAAYPALHVPTELERASIWLLVNPAKRPKSNLLRFLNGWIGRAIKPAPAAPASASTPTARPANRVERGEAFGAALQKLNPANQEKRNDNNVIDV